MSCFTDSTSKLRADRSPLRWLPGGVYTDRHRDCSAVLDLRVLEALLTSLLSLVLHALTYQQVLALCLPDVSYAIHVCSARILDCSFPNDFLLQPKQSFKTVNDGSRETAPWCCCSSVRPKFTVWYPCWASHNCL